jgi:hypothetical protein
VELGADEVAVLRSLAEGPGVRAEVAVRARIVLCAGRGLRRAEISREVGVSLPTVDRWLRRYVERGVPGLGGDTPGRPGHGRAGGSGPTGPSLSEDGASSSVAGSGDLVRVDDGGDDAVFQVWVGPSRAVPPPASGVRRGSQAIPRTVVEQFLVVEPGSEAEILRREQTEALLKLLRWMAEHPEPPVAG